MIVQQQRFRVVFSGAIDKNRDLETVKQALAERFKLTPMLVERLMAGRPIVVKSNVDAETAYKYKSEIDSIGGISRIEPQPSKSDLDSKGYIERRKNERRFRTDRRKVHRAGAIQPDRRRKDRRVNGAKPDDA